MRCKKIDHVHIYEPVIRRPAIQAPQAVIHEKEWEDHFLDRVILIRPL